MDKNNYKTIFEIQKNKLIGGAAPPVGQGPNIPLAKAQIDTALLEIDTSIGKFMTVVGSVIKNLNDAKNNLP